MTSRRDFLREFGLSAAVLPFVLNLPSLGWASTRRERQRLLIVFSPNGTMPESFWPQRTSEEHPTLELPAILQPLAEFKDQLITLRGVCDQVQGDGDNHMRGMGCLLTGVELFPGNIQGGSHTPAGWASGHSIDQEIQRFLQRNPDTQTRFGSLEFGVAVSDRADTWTRMIYGGANQPIAPLDDPYQMLNKLYGQAQDRESLRSVLDVVQSDLAKVRSLVSQADRQLLDEHTTFVRQMEQQLAADAQPGLDHAIPQLEPGVRDRNDNIPRISRMQIELIVSSFAADFTRVASLQYTNSVGQAKMHWLEIDESHHELSHEPDSNAAAVEKLVRINQWYAGEIAHLARRLAETPEPGGSGSLLDHTQILWVNELGKGNSHTLNDIPVVLLGGGLGFRGGQSHEFSSVPHNRLHVTLANAFGHEIREFGKPDFCTDGPLTGLT